MNTLFKKSALALVAVTLAVPVATTTSITANAGSRDAFVGGLVGGVVGGVIGSAHRNRRPDVVYVEPRRPVYVEPRRVSRGGAHVNWCYSRYRSYDARSNTFVSYGGRVKQCFSPYN